MRMVYYWWYLIKNETDMKRMLAPLLLFAATSQAGGLPRDVADTYPGSVRFIHGDQVTDAFASNYARCIPGDERFVVTVGEALKMMAEGTDGVGVMRDYKITPFHAVGTPTVLVLETFFFPNGKKASIARLYAYRGGTFEPTSSGIAAKSDPTMPDDLLMGIADPYSSLLGRTEAFCNQKLRSGGFNKDALTATQ